MNIILFGQKNSGKTFFGKKLAKYLTLPFIDTDEQIEKNYYSLFKNPLNCSEIFKKDKIFFRYLEKTTILNLQTKNHIISLGAFSILDPDIKNSLKGNFLYLYISLKTFLKRGKNDKVSKKIYERRSLLYEKISSYKINTEILCFKNFLCQIPLEKFLK